MARYSLHGVKVAARAAAFACLGLACCAAGLPPASAAEIENKDGSTYTVTIEEKGQRSTHKIAVGARIEGVCLDGCIVILDGVSDGAYRLPEGNEIVSIEEGVLFYDGAIAAKVEQP